MFERAALSKAMARSLWGWQPRYSLEQGIDETIAWIERHIDRFRVDVYTT